MLLSFLVALATQPAGPAGPDPRSNIALAAPIKTSDEGIPLGNGVLGALLWGEGHLIRLSLDRADVWDLRPQGLTESPDWTYGNLLRLKEAKDQTQIVHLFDGPYDKPHPTKLPGFRLQIDLGEDAAPEDFDLDLRTGRARFTSSRGEGQFVIPPGDPVLVGRLSTSVRTVKLLASPALGPLGFPPAEYATEPRGSYVLQATEGNLDYAAYVCTRKDADATEVAVSFATNAHNANALKEARRIAVEALGRGYRRAEAATANWWADFNRVSEVRVPDPPVQRQYDLAMYMYGAGARRGSPPLALQGLWTSDDGKLPPWKGDYHNDLNTQLIYWPYLASGHWDQGEGLLDWLWSQVPEYTRFAREFYNQTGAAIPGVSALDGKPLGGWPMYSLSPTMGLWVAMAFVDQWRYSGDDGFLRKRAYPFCKLLGQCARGLMRKDGDGNWVLPASSSPEIHDNTLRAWLTPNSNFDLAVLKAFFGALARMAEHQHKAKDAAAWKDVTDHLGPFHISPKDGGLRLDAKEDLEESHRHFSHLVAIHPFGLLNVDNPDDRKVIDASLDHLKPLGTGGWCGYSFAWMACIDARCGRPEEALKYLDIYANAFVLRNGFHANGDQSGRGYSDFTYRPFTLEGNFAAAEAVHEMLLQSWDGKVRLFPACPWPDASFSNLRAKGGFAVSGRLRAGRVVAAEIRATVGGNLLAVTPGPVDWSTPRGTVRTARLEIPLRPGETVMVKGGT